MINEAGADEEPLNAAVPARTKPPTWVGTLMQALLRSVLSVSTTKLLIWSLNFVTELLAEDGVLGELHHLLGDHASRRLELPPLAVLELHEVSHEGAGEAVGRAAFRPRRPARSAET